MANALSTTEQSVSDLLTSAGQVITDSQAHMNASLYGSTNKIQSILNDVFSQNGLITQSQYSQLDEEVRLAKLNLLKSKSQDFATQILVYGAIFVVGIGILAYFANNKKQAS